MNDIGPIHIKDDVSIVLGGEAGQGIATVEQIITRVLKSAGYHFFSTQEFMSRIRGGSNSNEIRVASRRVACFVNRIDILIPLDKDAIPHLVDRISSQTVILGEQARLATDRPIIDVPFFKIATEVGNAIYANTVAAGVILGLLRIEPTLLDEYLRRFFATKSVDVIDKNVVAGRRGYDIGRDLSTRIQIDITPNEEPRGDILCSGAEAVGLGAIAGGCNFIAAYPMSPSTAIFQTLSNYSRDFGILVEQAEDEISAMNMGIGASYAGARPMANTAGGGFALMVEALSLSGMIETPIVIHIGMRPAPATGLPTRSEQGDLMFALNAAHGEFPRVILTPGTLAEAFALTQKAFNLADEAQCPVFVLTDQYTADSSYNTPPFDLTGMRVEKQFVRTDKDYQRYRFTDSGVSPRGLPGYGDGLVVLDSDEHYEDGHITEDFSIRTKMVDKRLRKLKILEAEAIPPTLVGPDKYRTLIVAWGSNWHVLNEALPQLGRDDVAVLHFSQVYPLHASTTNYLQRAERTVILENNATAQFGRLIRQLTGHTFTHQVLKYNGLPFHVEEVVTQLKKIVG
jgi:2-oxoglutarate/2-oxoacid ferredoxin oxidoreductase subunit alpha